MVCVYEFTAQHTKRNTKYGIGVRNTHPHKGGFHHDLRCDEFQCADSDGAKKLKRGLTLLPLVGIIYFTVCGGTFGIEPLVGWSGPGLGLLMLFIIPLIFSVPIMLMVREIHR